MGRTTQELAGVRDGIRRQWLLPVPPAFPDAPDIEDTNEETLALFAKQRLISGPLLRALRSGNPDAIEATRPRAPRGLPRGTGRFEQLQARHNVGGLVVFSFRPAIGFPYVIRHVHVTIASAAAAGTEGAAEVTLHLTGGDRTGEIALPPEPIIWPDRRGGTSLMAAVVITGTAANEAGYPAQVLVTETGQFLSAAINSVGGAVPVIGLGVTIEEVDLSAWSLGDLLPLGRAPISRAARPPIPRTTTPQPPRGAIIRVTQGGRILAERRVPWEAMAPEIRAKWFAQQIGQPPDPSLEWIQ